MLTFVSQVLHSEEQKPPSLGRGWRRRRRRIGASGLSVFLKASPSSFLGKEPALRDRSAHKRALLLIGQPSILSASEASRYMLIMSHFPVTTSLREGVIMGLLGLKERELMLCSRK